MHFIKVHINIYLHLMKEFYVLTNRFICICIQIIVRLLELEDRINYSIQKEKKNLVLHILFTNGFQERLPCLLN